MSLLIYAAHLYLYVKKMQKFEDLIKNKAIVISTHEFASGFAQYLEEYLSQNKIKNLLYIHHPLYLKSEIKSGFRRYENGELIKEYILNSKETSAIFSFTTSFLKNIFWVFESGKRWDLYIGSNNLNALSGLFLKKIGLVKKCVFYTVDFIPDRFTNKFLNNIYLWIDGLCTKYCDETWILSPRVIEGRHKYLHLDKKYDKKQILVPEGVFLRRIKHLPFEKIKKHTAVFVGHLVERMGLQMVIKAIPDVIKNIPDFKLIIIGRGGYEENLKELVKSLGVDKNVQFAGYIKNHKDVENLIASCAVGIACYKKDDSSFTYYAEPSKTKVYLGAGIPVIMTDMFYNAYDIEKKGAGIVVDYDEKSITKSVVRMLNDEDKLKEYKEKAVSFIKEYDWELIFQKNLLRVFNV